jgi:cyclopropane-fatty-acyl-phospholipid synthase
VAVRAICAETYGPDRAALWLQRWRLFFLGCAELFAYRGGREWFVAHALLAPARG